MICGAVDLWGWDLWLWDLWGCDLWLWDLWGCDLWGCDLWGWDLCCCLPPSPALPPLQQRLLEAQSLSTELHGAMQELQQWLQSSERLLSDSPASCVRMESIEQHSRQLQAWGAAGDGG